MAHGTDVCDFRRSGCRHTPFLRSRKCCLLSHKKNLTGRSRAAADDVNGTGPARRLAWQSRDKRDRRAQSRPRDQSRTTVAIARTTEIGESAAQLPNDRPPNGKPNALPTSASKGCGKQPTLRQPPRAPLSGRARQLPSARKRSRRHGRATPSGSTRLKRDDWHRSQNEGVWRFVEIANLPVCSKTSRCLGSR